jgi:uracil-DNA glycosylase
LPDAAEVPGDKIRHNGVRLKVEGSDYAQRAFLAHFECMHLSLIMVRAKVPARSALDYIPETKDIAALREAADKCQGCDLYLKATQTVFGEGRKNSEILFVGEQPGDQEDRAGKPFVGPAGGLLDECMVEAGIDRSKAYVTNAVKHFKWEPRGKLRIHKKPTSLEIGACRPWLEAEIRAVSPKLIVCLGATAAQSLLGSDFRVTRQRGVVVEAAGLPPIVATVHPSSILRAQGDESRAREKQQFIDDLKGVAKLIARGEKPAG